MKTLREKFEQRYPNPLPDKLVFGEIIDQDMWAPGVLSEAELIIAQQYHKLWLAYRQGAEDKEFVVQLPPRTALLDCKLDTKSGERKRGYHDGLAAMTEAIEAAGGSLIA